MTEHVMNEVRYLRAEGLGLDTLGISIITELYGIARDAKLDLITEGFDWPSQT
jgi:hypothetical protein